MFSNPGGKLQGIAKVAFVLGIIPSVLGGIAVMILASRFLDDAAGIIVGILAMIVVIGIGILISWLSCIGLYAFGRLVKNSDELVAMAHSQTRGPGAVTSAPAAYAPVVSAPMADARPAAAGRNCPSCGAPMMPGQVFCTSCGTRMGESGSIKSSVPDSPKNASSKESGGWSNPNLV